MLWVKAPVEPSLQDVPAAQAPAMLSKKSPDDSSPSPSKSSFAIQVFPSETPDTVEKREAISTTLSWIPDPQNLEA